MWYSGGLRPERPEILPADFKLPTRGSLFIGKKGVMIIVSGGSNPRIFPEKLAEKYTPPKPSIFVLMDISEIGSMQ